MGAWTAQEDSRRGVGSGDIQKGINLRFGGGLW